VDWTHLVKDRDKLRLLVNTVTKLRVAWKVGKFLTILVIIIFSKRLFPKGLVSWLVSYSVIEKLTNMEGGKGRKYSQQ
jgi:hypothetical protein